MALQIWLPLNKENDFKSIGLLDNIFSKADAPTYNSSGKIGGCYSFDGTDDDFHSTTDKSFWSGKEISFACWFKSDKTKANGTLIEIGADLCINYYYNNSGVRFAYWRSYSNNSNRTGDSQVNPVYYNADLWHHIVVTFDHLYNKMYVDGQLSKEWDLSSLYTTNWVALLGNTYNLIAIGKSYGSSTTLVGGLMNDVRIYDHCLTPQEVKELAKGLAVHYTMSSADVYEATTNKFAYPTPGSAVGAIGWNQSLHPNAIYVNGWGPGYNGGVEDPGTVYHAMWNMVDGIPTMVFLDLNSTKGHTHSWEGISGGVSSGNNSEFTFGRKYTVSFTAKSSVDGGAITCGLYYQKTSGGGYNFYDGRPQTTLTTGWKRYSVTYTCEGVYNISSFYFYGMYGNEGIKYVRDVLLEFLDHDTPYTLSSRSEGIVYDSSGYCKNLTIKGSLSIADSPRYDKSVVCNSTTHMYNTTTGVNGSSETEMTVSCWFYQTDRSGYQGLVGNRGASGSTGSSSPLNWYLYTHNDDGSIQFHGSSLNKSSIIPTLNAWHHVVAVVKSNNKYDLYLDGSKVISDVSYTWGGSTQRLVVSGYGSGGESFRGRLSDVRIYATALSQQDITDLYSLGASIS